MEWSEKRPRITQKSIARLGDGWIRSKCLRKFLCKMMRLVKVLMETRKPMGEWSWKVVARYEIFVYF